MGNQDSCKVYLFCMKYNTDVHVNLQYGGSKEISGKKNKPRFKLCWLQEQKLCSKFCDWVNHVLSCYVEYLQNYMVNYLHFLKLQKTCTQWIRVWFSKSKLTKGFFMTIVCKK